MKFPELRIEEKGDDDNTVLRRCPLFSSMSSFYYHPQLDLDSGQVSIFSIFLN